MLVPTCRIIRGRAMACGHGVADHAFYSSANPAHRFGEGQPFGLDHAQHGGSVNLGDRRFADRRIGVNVKARQPDEYAAVLSGCLVEAAKAAWSTEEAARAPCTCREAPAGLIWGDFSNIT